MTDKNWLVAKNYGAYPKDKYPPEVAGDRAVTVAKKQKEREKAANGHRIVPVHRGSFPLGNNGVYPKFSAHAKRIRRTNEE